VDRAVALEPKAQSVIGETKGEEETTAKRLIIENVFARFCRNSFVSLEKVLATVSRIGTALARRVVELPAVEVELENPVLLVVTAAILRPCSWNSMTRQAS